MVRITSSIIFILTLTASTLAAPSNHRKNNKSFAPLHTADNAIPNKYIVVLKDSVSQEAATVHYMWLGQLMMGLKGSSRAGKGHVIVDQVEKTFSLDGQVHGYR
jgi:hypothetical protein